MSRRILFLIPSLSMGGAERVTANLANYWVDKGWQVAVATLDSADDDFYVLDSRIERIALCVAKPSRNVYCALRNNLRSLRLVRRLLKAWQPDTAIGMMTTANVYLALAGHGLPIQRIGSEHIHPPMMPLGKIWEKMRAYCYRWLDSVVALTEPSADWLCQHTKARNVHVIPNPIPWPLPSQEPAREPSEVKREGRKVCLAVGRLTYQKGFDLLLHAFSVIAERFSSWDLVIAGDGELYEDLQHQIQHLGLLKRVHLIGRVGNLGDWYEAADMYVMSSRYEGFGNTLAEAMSYGLPVASFDCQCGPSYIIRHEIDGLLVPNGDVQALSMAMARLMGDEKLRHMLSVRAVDARERFSLVRIASMWERVFEYS